MEAEMRLSHSESLLNFSINEIKHIDEGTFMGLCMFTHLSLNRYNLSVLYSDTFQGSMKLRSLDLRKNNPRIIETVSFSGQFYLTSPDTTDIYDLPHHIGILHAGIFQGTCGPGQLDLSYFEMCVIENVCSRISGTPEILISRIIKLKIHGLLEGAGIA
jgi:hypothetical protein